MITQRSAELRTTVATAMDGEAIQSTTEPQHGRLDLVREAKKCFQETHDGVLRAPRPEGTGGSTPTKGTAFLARTQRGLHPHVTLGKPGFGCPIEEGA